MNVLGHEVLFIHCYDRYRGYTETKLFLKMEQFLLFTNPCQSWLLNKYGRTYSYVTFSLRNLVE